MSHRENRLSDIPYKLRTSAICRKYLEADIENINYCTEYFIMDNYAELVILFSFYNERNLIHNKEYYLTCIKAMNDIKHDDQVVDIENVMNDAGREYLLLEYSRFKREAEKKVLDIMDDTD